MKLFEWLSAEIFHFISSSFDRRVKYTHKNLTFKIENFQLLNLKYCRMDSAQSYSHLKCNWHFIVSGTLFLLFLVLDHRFAISSLLSFHDLSFFYCLFFSSFRFIVCCRSAAFVSWFFFFVCWWLAFCRNQFTEVRRIENNNLLQMVPFSLCKQWPVFAMIFNLVRSRSIRIHIVSHTSTTI